MRAFLNDWRYAFREFSVPGDRNNVGGILGIDPSSYDRSMLEKADELGVGAMAQKAGAVGESTKVRVLRREDVEREAEEAKMGGEEDELGERESG